MSNNQQTQAFYSLTLQAPSAVQSAIACNVDPRLKPQDQQIFEACGQYIRLRRIQESADRSEVKVVTFAEQDCFGIIRGVAALRIPGTKLDKLIVSSDSGRLTMLDYDHEKGAFKRVHSETYGKSGIRRTIPGQYLASDPHGRCCMLASTEKNKVVYIVNRDSENGVVISSPHEANQWASLTFAVCGLDTGWEHPVFAALEVDYSDIEGDGGGLAGMYENREKQLVYYTVDLGLNHVVKRWSDKVDYTANMIFGVPGGQDGPSGVLVCCEDRIYYRHDKHEPLCIPIPRRAGPTEDPNRKRIIISGCMHLSRVRHEFFFLLQTEDGDVFKLSIGMAKNEQGVSTMVPESLQLKYYETFPAAKQMVLIRKGYIYVAAENGHSKVYHVNDLADDLDFEPEHNFSSTGYSAEPEAAYKPLYFTPRGLTFTSLAEDLPSLNPLMRASVDNPLNEDAPQIYTIQGTGNASAFKTIRHGLEIEEMVSSSIGNIDYNDLWSLKHRASDVHHSYLLLSSNYADQTICLSIGDSVETMEDSPFLGTRATIEAASMGDATLVQVHQRGVRSIYESGEINEWPSPEHRTIISASANQRQLLLGLSSSELCYFMIGEDGILRQLEDMPEIEGKITAMSVGKPPKGQQQAKFAVVGCDNNQLRVLSLSMDSPLELRSIQGLTAAPSSLEVVEELDPESGTNVTFVHIGLESGVYLRALIDEVTGELGEVRTRFLGPKRARIFPVDFTMSEEDEGAKEGNLGMIACSSRSWMAYNDPQTRQYSVTPLMTTPLEAVRPFVSEHLRGICGIQGSQLLIFAPPSTDRGHLYQTEVRLKYTPRAMARNPYYPIWYVAQSDANTISVAVKEGLKLQNGESERNGGEADEDIELHSGLSRGDGHWASAVSAVDPLDTQSITSSIELEENEAALCIAAVPFASREWECYLAVGTGQHMRPGSGVQSKGYVHIYRLVEEGRRLEFVHKTAFDMPIYAILAFQGRLAIGIGSELFIYDIGMKALLRKSRGTAVPNQIVNLQSSGNRIVCGDVSESVTYLVFKQQHNRLIAFADDSISRWTTTTAMIDYETTAGGDKFGNLWIVRCPEQASQEADEEGINGYIVNERSYLNGTPYRLELRAHFYAQDIPTSMQRTALIPGGSDVLFWCGLQGTMGILIPFQSREDVDFFSNLESLIRGEEVPLAGRDHLMYRSYYVPVKAVVDGDLCERFMRLGYDSKQKIAAETEREVREIERKVQEMRTRVAF